MKAPPLATSGASSIIAIATLLLMMPAPAQAEGQDTAAYVSRSLRCDGFDRQSLLSVRRSAPARQALPTAAHASSSQNHDAHDTRYVVERRSLAPPYVHEHAWRDRDHSGREHSWREGGRYRDRDRDYRDRDYDRRDRYGRHDRHERECLHPVTAKGTEAQTENGALVSAKRAWRAWVRSDHGERYQDLDAAKNGEYRCWRSSTNESTIGKVGEFLTGQYRKRCQVWAVPCLGERHTLDGDKDDRE